MFVLLVSGWKAWSCDTYKCCVFHRHHTIGFVNVDFCLGIFLFSVFSVQNAAFILLAFAIANTTVIINVTKIECFIPKRRVSWTKSG